MGAQHLHTFNNASQKNICQTSKATPAATASSRKRKAPRLLPPGQPPVTISHTSTSSINTTGGTQVTHPTVGTHSIISTQATDLTPGTQATAPGVPSKPNPNTCWTDANDATMAHTLINEKAAHPSALNGFKKSSWMQVIKALAGSEKLTYLKAKDIVSCKARWYATVKNMLGAGWDEWEELALNTSAAGKELTQWEKQGFPLFYDLVALVEPGSAKGNLAETTADEGLTASGDIGNDIPPDSPVELDVDEDDLDIDEPEVTVAPVSSTQSPSKRKRGSAISPTLFFSELKSMSTSLAKAMSAPIPPISFMPSAPQALFHMQACVLVQKDPTLEPDQIFKAINFLGVDKNAEVYVSLSEILRPTWLRMKLGW
ncbi:hypothetical protein MJO28_003948 [Puccinia striiformis f. sp. tritici]|uniref:Uncharacterized protein n=1 Tax=Puccinia striiformis f. sp. tritici TaxID=168172 RepID=A0ACC0EMG8_9BASI|nr:hypothetical protein MJO28_003948 [Puccinia striiformis f. sp. tritici]